MYNKENLHYEPFFSKFNTSKKNVLIVLTTLSNYETSLLAKKHGYDLERVSINKKLTEEENRIINENITKKIKKRIECLKNKTHIIIKITDILPNDVTTEEVLQLFETDNNYVARRYTNLFGSDLKRRLFTRKENKISLKNALKEYIEKNKSKMKHRHNEFISFINILKEYKLENETDEVFLKRTKKIIKAQCDEKEIELLERKYGPDYQNTINYGQFTLEENLIIHHKILRKTAYYLRKEKRGVIYCKPLMKRLLTTSYEEALIEIENEPEHNKNLLKKKFNDDYLGVTPINAMTKEENKKIKNIIAQINRRLEKNKNIIYCEPLITRFDKLTTIGEVLEEIAKEKEENQSLLKKKYQDNYLGITSKNSISKEENNKIKRIIKNINKRIINKRIKRTNICKNALLKIKELLNTEEYLNLAKLVGEREAISILTIKYMSLDLSIESLSKLTNLSISYILTITKEYLEKEQRPKQDNHTLEIKNSGGVTKK